MNDDAAKRAKEYVAIELWYSDSGYPPCYWQDLQEKAAAEGAPLDAIYWNVEARRWLRVRDLRAGHPFRRVVELDSPHLLLEGLRAAHSRAAELRRVVELDSPHFRGATSHHALKQLRRHARRFDGCLVSVAPGEARAVVQQVDELLATLRELVERCDGAEGVRADGSNIQTVRAHAVLDDEAEGA